MKSTALSSTIETTPLTETPTPELLEELKWLMYACFNPSIQLTPEELAQISSTTNADHFWGQTYQQIIDVAYELTRRDEIKTRTFIKEQIEITLQNCPSRIYHAQLDILLKLNEKKGQEALETLQGNETWDQAQLLTHRIQQLIPN